jgi:hypothetical protein
MGGQLGVSGDARMLIAQTALEFGEVGTLMIVNQSTRETAAYHCVTAPTVRQGASLGVGGKTL